MSVPYIIREITIGNDEYLSSIKPKHEYGFTVQKELALRFTTFERAHRICKALNSISDKKKYTAERYNGSDVSLSRYQRFAVVVVEKQYMSAYTLPELCRSLTEAAEYAMIKLDKIHEEIILQTKHKIETNRFIVSFSLVSTHKKA